MLRVRELDAALIPLTQRLRRHAAPLMASLIALIVLGCNAGQDAAQAKPAEKAIWGPVTLPSGASAFPTYHDLGVDVYQIQLIWSDVAKARPADPTDPADPAYVWPKALDTAAEQAAKYHIQLAVMLRGTPAWANGGADPSYAPTDAQDYANFAAAAARRYGAVRRWMIWGEPTRAGNFNPMPANSPVGPRRYALLLDAAYGALKAVRPSNIVIGGMTWTVGLDTPVDFIRWMRLPNGKPPRMDWYGHNPFSTRFPDLSADPYVKGIRDLSDIDTLHQQLAGVYKGRVPKLWLSEFTIASDRANRAFSFSVSRRQQAAWVTAAFKLVNSTSYVAGLGWFDLYDEDPSVKNSLTNGLMTYAGQHKPAYAAYKAAK